MLAGGESKVTNFVRFRDIVLNPCNASAERRNTAAIREALEELSNAIKDQGDEVVPFKVQTTAVGASTVAVLAVNRDLTPWVFDQAMVAYDYSPDGRFGPNMVAGHYGFGRLAPEISDTALEIIELDGMARFIEGSLTGNMTSGEAPANTTTAYGAYPNSMPPTDPVTVYDRLSIMSSATTGQDFLAIWDEQDQKDIIVAPQLSTPRPSTRYPELVRVVGTGSVSTGTGCVWDAYIQTISAGSVSGGDVCGTPWSDGEQIWVLEANNKTPIMGERYIALKLNVAFDPGTGSRQLYVLKDEDLANPGLVIAEVDTGSNECSRLEVDESNCLFSAKISTFSPTGTVSACDSFGTNTSIWLTPINDCHCGPRRVKTGDRFLAQHLQDDFGPSTDERPLYGFRIADADQTAVVEVSGSTCDDIDEPESCLYAGQIKEQEPGNTTFCDGANLEDAGDCKIVVLNQCDPPAFLKGGERFIGQCIGKDGDSGNPVFGIQAKPQVGQVRWARATTNWYHVGGRGCHYCYVKEIPMCGVSSDFIPPGPELRVYLPSGQRGHPNIEADNDLAFVEMANGDYICVTDYLDASIGTVRMYVPNTSIGPGQGWHQMNGNQYSENDNYSETAVPTNMSGKNARGTISGGLVGTATKGREKLCKEDIGHTHRLIPESQSTHKAYRADVGDDGIHVIEANDCMPPPNVHNHYVHDSEGFLVDMSYSRLADESALGVGCGTPVPNPITGVSGPAKVDPICADDYGAINIMNPYAWLLFIERIDNSEVAEDPNL